MPRRSILRPWQRPLHRVLVVGFVLLAGGGLFLLETDGASAPAAWALLLHLLGGVLLAPVLVAFALPHAWVQLRRRPAVGLGGLAVLLLALAVAASGALLALARPSLQPAWLGSLHAFGGFGLLLLYALHRRFGTNPAPLARPLLGAAGVLVLAAGFAAWERVGAGHALVAEARDAGSQPFLPSMAETASGTWFPDSGPVSDVARCASCHPRIARDWQRSAHRHASMTNPFYKGTVRAMQARYPARDVRWCAGCHDPALLFTGKMDDADLDLDQDPDARVGLTCLSCHAIEPSSTLGNGHYVQRERVVYAWELSEDPAVRAAHEILLRAKPQAHAESLRPDGIGESAFCATCHKAEVPEQVNRWKWLRVQDEYDDWDDSGVSLGSVRSFYHPPHARRCQDCHMPLVPDPEDPAADADGMVRDHLFAAANTALPYLRGDEEMVESARAMLRQACRVDVTAVVLEPSEAGESRRLFAPAWRALPAVRPREVVEAQVVVRNHGVGHPFPAGTVDSNEVWLRFEASVEGEAPFYVSGAIDEATGRVDPSAEFYRSYVVDGEGRRVVNRLGPDIRTRVYVKRIGPGAADVVRYRFRVPEDARGRIEIRATLRYRKFMREYLDFLFPDGLSIEHRLEDGRLVTVDLTDLPVVDMADGSLRLPVTPEGTSGPAPDPDEAAAADDLLRLNDLGIALLLQGDPHGAARIFESVVRLDPGYADGWVNVGRAAIEKLDWTRAVQALARAREIVPRFAKARFFEGEMLRRLAYFPEAEDAFREVLEQWPREREGHRLLAEVLYEQGRYAEALEVLESLFAIDPEDARGWFWAVRCYGQIGDEERARAAEEAFDRYRDDDDESARRAAIQVADPDLLRMGQRIHVHRQAGVR